MKVSIVSITNPVVSEVTTAEELIVYCARVSNPENQFNFDTGEKLIKYMITNGHWSPFEMASMCVEIETSHAIAKQILRHRSFSFQEFCVSGDTLITTDTKGGRTKKVTIENLYKRFTNSQYWGMADNLVRVYDEKTKLLTKAKIKEVFKTGEKEVHELTLDNNKKIKATAEHKFLTFDGFKRLKDITEDDFIATNGIPLHQNYEWLKNAKELSIQNKTGVQGIADMAGWKYNTIRKWLKIHKLTFTNKERGATHNVWNKGLPKEQQPNYNKFASEETRAKQSKSAKHGKDCCLYIHGNSSKRDRNHRLSIAAYSKPFHLELLTKQGFKCAATGEAITKETSEVDHILPVYARPDLAFDRNNLQVLSKAAHKEKTLREALQSKHTISYHKVRSIEYVGMEETYDMEVEHDSHNYVANGMVTHNSLRYSSNVEIEHIEPRLQGANRQGGETYTLLPQGMLNRMGRHINESISLYGDLLDLGIARECARMVLPLAGRTRLYMNGTIRSWIHYLQQRLDKHAQKEHRLIAQEIANIFKDKFPIIYKVAIDERCKHFE